MSLASPQFGALELPAPLSNGDSTTAGDPCLDVLLAFASAVLRYGAGDVHGTVSPGTGDVVKVTRAHNPGHVVLNEKDFPALYAWRLRGDVETIADDYDIETSVLSLLWVFPLAQADWQARRNPMVNALSKALTAALRRGRHPSWVMSGDTEAQAARNGSFLWSWAGLWSVRRLSWKVQDLVAQKAGVETTYPALQWEITVEERAHLGVPDAPARALNTIAPAGESPQVTFQLPP